MISGSICGGTEALQSDLFLYSNMFLAMGDVAAATALALAATTPMGFMAGCLLFTLVYVATIESISLIVLYQHTWDDAYIRQAAINTLINVAAISAGLAIGQAAKTIGKLIGSQVDDVVDGVRPGIRPVGPGGGGAGGPGSALLPDDILEEIIEKYGDDVADAISKHGKKGTQLYEEFGDDFAQAVKNLGDADDVIRLTDDYAGRADEVLDVINRYGDDAIRLVDDYGDEFLDHASSMDDLDEIKGLLGDDYITLKHRATSGVELVSTPGKTTTILGRYGSDTGPIIEELGIPKNTDFSGNPGGFNLLNTPDEYYVTPEQFWNEYNKPFLDAAIERDDVILMATPIKDSNLYLQGTTEYTGYGREYFYLLDCGYTYVGGKMIRK